VKPADYREAEPEKVSPVLLFVLTGTRLHDLGKVTFADVQGRDGSCIRRRD
jgi:hypothetical protein